MASNDSHDVLQAGSINVAACDTCPGVHINMMNADGEIFATALLPFECGGPFMESVARAMEKIVKRQGGLQ